MTSNWKLFHSNGDKTTVGEGLQNLAWPLIIVLPLGEEGSISCHECCEMGITLWGELARGGGAYLNHRPILVTSDDKQGVSGPILTRVPQEKNSMFI